MKIYYFIRMVRYYDFNGSWRDRQKRYNMRFGGLLFNNATSDCLETSWVTPWGSDLSIWIEIVLWKQRVSFLELSKNTGRSGRMWDFESFYYLIKHQIVLKLLEWHHGIVECQSELKLFCGNRDFPFKSHSKSQTEQVEYDFWRAFIM